MKYKLIACDLDGTLLSDDKHISKENIDAIKKLAEAGVEFVPNTGRAFAEIPECVKEIPQIRYFIDSDGTVVFDRKENKRYVTGISKERLVRIFGILKEYKTFAILHADGNAYYERKCFTEEHCRLCRMSGEWTDMISSANIGTESFEKLIGTLTDAEMFAVFFPDDESLAGCRERLAEADGGLYFTKSSPYNIEFFDSRGGKAAGLKRLAEKIGADISETIAVGDGDNDSDMIRAAGLGLAVANAKSSLKAVADAVICSNEEHVIKYIAESIIAK